MIILLAFAYDFNSRWQKSAYRNFFLLMLFHRHSVLNMKIFLMENVTFKVLQLIFMVHYLYT